MVKMPIPCDIITSDQGPSGSTGSASSNGSTSSHPSKSSNLNDACDGTKSSSSCNGKHSPLVNGSNVTPSSSSPPSQQPTNGHAAGYIDEDVDDEPNKSANDTVLSSSSSTSKPATNEQEFIFIHDTGFTVKIHAPGCEPFDIQVSSMELVQEIHHLLMDREDTCHRTCFSLQFEGVTLDHFAELKTIEGLKEGSIIKVVEEPYTVREARIHVRHVRDLLKLLDPTDAYNGVEGSSLSFLGVISQGDDKKRGLSRSESVDCTPPDFIVPGCKDRFILPLQPQTKDQKNPVALKVLTTSGWNPPPGPRKLHGDLMYLFIVTSEDKRFHLTASTRGFYINQSSEEEFNPRPAPPKLVYHSLIDLLSQISPIFKRNFALIQKKRQLRHPFERVTTPYQLYSWTSPHLDHTIDSIRAEDAFSSKLGYEEHIPGQTRDWNEELQTTRELARKTLPERLLRERAIFKVHSDFVGAATRGAMAVIDGNVMAINPGEETKMQMFIWNNIFFSLGFDVRDHYKDLGGDAAAFVAPNNDLQGVRAYTAVDVEGLYTLGTVVINYRGYRVTAQSIIPGILEREQEQSVVYGSVDFGKTVVTHPKYLELLGKAGQSLKILPHKVFNEKNEEVQICSSVECKGIIGNDGRHYILDLLRTFPADVNFLPLDDLDEYTKEVKALGFPRKHRHKLCCLRQELVDAFFEARYLMFIRLAAYHLQQIGAKNEPKESTSIENNNEAVEEGEQSKPEEGSEEYKKMVESYASGDKSVIDSTKDIVKKAAQAAGSLKETEFDVRFNPDVYSDGVRHVESPAELKKQRQLVKDAADFLVTNQIPSLIRDCLENVIAPFDGSTLSEALHNRGINIRYLGTVANQLKNIPQLEYLQSICVTELLTRAAKRIFTTYIQGVEMTNLASAISHFLNCFLSSCPSVVSSVEEVPAKSTKKRSRRKNRSSIFVTQESTEWTSVTQKSFWNTLKEELDSYYGWTLPSDGIDVAVESYSLQKVTLLRSFCIKTGIQLLLREYNMDNKSKGCFGEDDIVNMFPVVKHIHPKASDAYNFYTTGQTKIQQGCLKEGYELISEALNLLNNVYGALHPEIAQCLRMLARLNYIMGDHAEAMAFQSKAVLMSEKVNGIDHPYTITEYAHLALYSFANSQVTTSLKMLYRARYLLLTISGENHPEMAIIDSNIGLILHAVGEYNLSLRFLENGLALNIKYFGAKSLKVAVSYHLVARTQSCQGDFRGALQNEKETFAIYKHQLGEEHEKTKESSECLRHLTQQAVVLQKKMNEICKGNASAVIPPIQIQSPTMSAVLDMLNVINGILFVQISPPETKPEGGAQESKLSEEVESKSNEVTCNGDHNDYETNESELE